MLWSVVQTCVHCTAVQADLCTGQGPVHLVVSSKSSEKFMQIFILQQVKLYIPEFIEIHCEDLHLSSTLWRNINLEW